MKILALTSIRSEYDLLSSLFFLLQEDSDIELKLLVGGAHNSSSFGMTVNDIKNDGFNILAEIDSLLDSDSAASRLKSASILLMSSIDIVKSYNPDLIIYAGDREEVMIGSLLGGYLSIPTLHFFGGDHASDGHIDNPIRHAVSKLSTCHFVSTEEHRRRLLCLGEPASRIYNIGSVALDKFKEHQSSSDILAVIAGKKISRPGALLIFHPIAEEIKTSGSILEDICLNLLESGYHVFIGSPNSDPGNSDIRQYISELSNTNENVTLYGNLPRSEFLSLFKMCSLIIGNSSAGLLEAASVPIPCINIGQRQRNRFCSENVIFVDATSAEIKQGLKTVRTPSFLSRLDNLKNVYGDGDSSRKALNLIKTLNFKEMLLKTEDPLINEK